MGDIIQLKAHLGKQKTEPKNQSLPVFGRQSVHISHISEICMAVAYYAGTGDPDTAHKILRYVNVYRLYNNYCRVTEEIEDLIKATEFSRVYLGQLNKGDTECDR
jgi:hypothetical protein